MALLLPYFERAQIEPIVGPISPDELRSTIPKNEAVTDWFSTLSAADQEEFADLSTGVIAPDVDSLDLVDAVESALLYLPSLKIGGVYERRFKRGEGEGRHSDPHDIVITQTNGAGADFSLWEGSSPTPVSLTDGALLIFHGRMDHEVGPAKGASRIIRAVGLDYS